MKKHALLFILLTTYTFANTETTNNETKETQSEEIAQLSPSDTTNDLNIGSPTITSSQTINDPQNDQTNVASTQETISDINNTHTLPQTTTIPQSSFNNIQLTTKDTKLPEPLYPQKRKKPWLAVSMSTLIPGLGHTYLSEYKKASMIFGSSAIGVGASFSKHTAEPGFRLLTLSRSYGIYAAYRDARLFNNNYGYKYKMPTDSFKDLFSAPFKWSVIKKPEVWGGICAWFTSAIVFTTVLNKYAKLEIPSCSTNPLFAFSVGLREEAIFRGFIQPALSEYLNPTGGLVSSSMLFGAAHMYNTVGWDRESRINYFSYSIPFITLFGGYFGWLSQKNNSLQESVAVHSWYDFLLFSLNWVSGNASLFKNKNFAFSFSF